MSFDSQRAFAILRAGDGARLLPAIETLMEAGLYTVEITLTTPQALETISAARKRWPDATFGAGTVMDQAGARQAIEAGAQFCVSPIVDAPMIAACVAAGVPSVPGAYSPTEIATASRMGAAAVKLFPSRLDGILFVKAVLAPMPWARLIPTGGVQIDEVPAYLEAGCVAAGLGSPLLRDALSGGSLDDLAVRTKRLLSLI